MFNIFFLILSPRSGSLIFDVVLNFNTIVTEDDTISTIQSSINDGKLGNLRVNVSFLLEISPVEQTTTGTPNIPTSKSHGLFLVVTAW